MRNPIRRLTAWLRIRREPATNQAPAASAAAAPAAPPARETPGACGIYVWATAHGIDLRPRHALTGCTCSTRADHAMPAVGTFVVDKRGERLAQVVAAEARTLRLREPAGGGTEWAAEPPFLRPATESERLRAKVAEANRASRWGNGA
ncbi:hypothetical protein [Streptosporangium nondiastaticum]|nr:hypothetical protein [Streptosporangium nondiastaticum]